MTVSDVFRRIIAALDRSGIPYMLSGSFASAHYGTPRSTQDIDFVIEASPTQLRALVSGLPTGEYYVELDAALNALRRESMFNVIDLATGWKIDLIVRKSRAFSETEFSRRQKVNLHGIEIFLVSAEDAVISKLEWAKRAQSQRQIEDVAIILRVRWDGLDHSYLEKWVRDLGLQKEWEQAKYSAGVE